MPTKRPPRDVNELARYVLEVTTGEAEKIEPPKKNAAAQALAALGASKGGQARAKKLSASKRKKIAKPAAKPKKKRYLTVTERHFLRRYRFQQVFFGVIIIIEPYNYQIFHSWLPKSNFDRLGLIMSLTVMSMYAALIVAIEKKEIKQIKNGEFMKRMKRLARERKAPPSVQH